MPMAMDNVPVTGRSFSGLSGSRTSPKEMPMRVSERWSTATTVGNHLIELELTATLIFTLASSEFSSMRVPVSEMPSGIVGKTASC
jgi:hypothetical protein